MSNPGPLGFLGKGCQRRHELSDGNKTTSTTFYMFRVILAVIRQQNIMKLFLLFIERTDNLLTLSFVVQYTLQQLHNVYAFQG